MSQQDEYQVVKMYSDSTRIADLIAVEILHSTNEKATDILGASGFDGLIAGTFYATLSEVIRFYSVNEKYINGIFLRFGFNGRTTPNDILSLRMSDFLREQNVHERYEIRGGGLYDKYERTYKKFAFQHEKKERFCSAKLILVMAALMYYGRRIPNGSIVLDIFERLKMTSYYTEARAHEEQNRQKRFEFLKARANEEKAEVFASPLGDLASLPLDKLVQLALATAQELNARAAV